MQLKFLFIIWTQIQTSSKEVISIGTRYKSMSAPQDSTKQERNRLQYPGFIPYERQCPASPNIIRAIKSRRMRWAGHAARMGDMRSAYSILAGKPEGKRPLVRPRCIKSKVVPVL
jgi:hypothetical protein